jgi:pilus assembly protein TadC
MADVALMLGVGGLLLGATLPWRAGAARRLAAISTPTVADRDVSCGARAMQSADIVLLLDLVDVAVSAGAGVPRALGAVGEAVGGDDGTALGQVATELLLGAPWRAAWAGAPPGLGPIADCLEAAWLQGAAPGPSLRARAGAIRRERRRGAREAAGRLGVHLVLLLGLCFLPAFVLLGLVPVLVSLAAGLIG